MHDLVIEDRRVSIKWISETLCISYGSVFLIDKLGLKNSAQWVPRMLTPDQKQVRVTLSEALLAQINADSENLFDRFVTMDETWVHHFDPETKQQSMEWREKGSTPPQKFRVQASAGKVMASVFWDCRGILLIDYLPHKQTITGVYYAELISKLREAIKAKRRIMLTRGVLFQQDNAPVHESEVAMSAIHSAGFELIDHPPYSPDLAPSDFFLFPNLKKPLRGIKFSSNEEVKGAVNQWFDSQDKTFFNRD